MKKKLMLPAVATDKKSSLYKTYQGTWNTNLTELDKRSNYTDVNYHHLYLTSNEEIKEGDWRINLETNHIDQTSKDSAEVLKLIPKDKSPFGKIVATTNPELWSRVDPDPNWKDDGRNGHIPWIPKIPDSLIQYFVEMQGNVKEVMVEYEDGVEYNTRHRVTETVNKLKLNSDGTIIWSKVEQKMYTREEVEKMMLQYNTDDEGLCSKDWITKYY